MARLHTGGLHAVTVIVGHLAAAQDDVAVLVARRGHDGRVAALRHRQEMVRLRRRLDRVQRNAHVAVRPVLEAHRARQPRSQLAVHLRLRRARPDGAPGNQVRDVLRRDHVQELGACRHAHRIDVQQQPPCQPQPLVDVEAAIQPRIIDQSLPAHRRARLLEIHPHHDLQPVTEALALLHQPRCIVTRSSRIVDRTGPDHHQQPIIHAVQDAMDRLARLRHRAGHRRTHRKLLDQMRRRDQLVQGQNAQIIGCRGGTHQLELLGKGAP